MAKIKKSDLGFITSEWLNITMPRLKYPVYSIEHATSEDAKQKLSKIFEFKADINKSTDIKKTANDFASFLETQNAEAVAEYVYLIMKLVLYTDLYAIKTARSELIKKMTKVTDAMVKCIKSEIQ